MRTIVFVLISAAFTLNVIKPPVALCQNVNFQRNECAISENLKPTKTVTGTYTEGAARKNVEGTVLLCVTVDGHGRVIDVSPLSGPAELLQLSMDAARKWQFEAPPKAPASTKIEMRYGLTKACPEGRGSDVGDIVTTIVPTDEKAGDLKILGKLYQPLASLSRGGKGGAAARAALPLHRCKSRRKCVRCPNFTKSLDELLDQSAVETVRTWRFKVSPGGRPTGFSVTLSFRIPCLDH